MNEILEEVATTLNLDYKLVETVMKAYFNFIKYRLSKTPYKLLTTFKGVKTNFLLVGFGKLVVKNKSDKRLNYGRRIKS